MARSVSQAKDRSKSLIERVTAALKSFGACRGAVLVAVSGGPDSTALLRVLAASRGKTAIQLSAVHVNHSLRGGESDADEQFVRDLCARRRIELVCRAAAVPLDPTARDQGIEATARQLRQQVFVDAARQLGASFVATAHTADDQAETVLHRLIRGTGLSGIAGIPASRVLAPGVTVIRPLLQIRRQDIVGYLAAIGQNARQDSSNCDLAFTRNRVRRELIPYLEQHFNPQVTDALTRLAALAAGAQQVVDRQVARLRRRAVRRVDRRTAVLHTHALRNTPTFLICELIRGLWIEQSWPLREIGASDLDRIAELIVDARRLGAWDLPGGVRAEWVRGQFVLRREERTVQ